MRRTLGQIKAVLSDGAAPATLSLSKRALAGIYLARLVLRILKQWARDRCPQQAAALTFQTALSLVPVLAIAFVVIRSAGFLDAESNLMDFVASVVLPNLPDVAKHLRGFADNISKGALGAGGLVFTFAACWSLYATVGKIFNDIWRVRVRRGLLYQFLIFYALVTLLPVLAGVYLYWSGKLVSAEAPARVLGPLTVQLAALFLTNKLLPNTVVRWRAAFLATAVSGVLLEALKWGFVVIARRSMLHNYTGVYGTVGLIPMVLIWMYASWLVILLGAEVANAIQNLKRLEAEDRRHRGDEPINGIVATQLLAAVASDFEQGGRGLTREALAHDFSLSPEIIERICERLKGRGLLAEVQGDKTGFIPGRPADTIALTEILGAFRSTDVEIADGRTSKELDTLIRDLDESRRARLASLTLADMLSRDDKVVPLPAQRTDG